MRVVTVALLMAGLTPLLGGCNEPTAASASQPPAPEISVVSVVEHPRAIVRELPGRIAPTRVADVRSRVSGIVVARLFQQGSEVKAGDPLYQVDPRPFEVEVQAQEAALDKAVASFEQAQQQARRIATLFHQKAVSEAEHERTVATLKQAEAEVAARQAELARARLNVEYATIRAPISGVIGAALISEGALVVQNDNTNLAQIQQLDPVYADFTQSVSDLNALRRAFANGDLEQIAPDAAKVKLVLDDGSIYPSAGKLLFSDAKVDSFTGQVTLRGEFANPGRELLPGMYVRVKIEQGIDTDAIDIPQQAVQRNAGGGSEVFLVKDDNRVIVQPIRAGSVHDGHWTVLEGLKPGDRVVVEGFQKFAPGDLVQPRDWKPKQAEASPAASAARAELPATPQK